MAPKLIHSAYHQSRIYQHNETFSGCRPKVPTKVQTALTVGWTLAMTYLSLIVTGNSQWVDFSHSGEHIWKTKSVWPAAHRCKLCWAFHFWKLNCFNSYPTDAVAWENEQNSLLFYTNSIDLLLFPTAASCVKGFSCCLGSCNYMLNWSLDQFWRKDMRNNAHLSRRGHKL
jgi:hypothetical protein